MTTKALVVYSLEEAIRRKWIAKAIAERRVRRKRYLRPWRGLVVAYVAIAVLMLIMH